MMGKLFKRSRFHYRAEKNQGYQTLLLPTARLLRKGTNTASTLKQKLLRKWKYRAKYFEQSGQIIRKN